MKLNRSLTLLAATLITAGATAPALASATETQQNASGAKQSATAADEAFVLQHAEGTLKLDARPSKVVSFELGILDSLTALGVPAAGVPKSVYEGPLARYQDAPVVGTLFEPNYTVLKGIKPDLIVAGGRSLKAVPELSKVAPTVTFATDPNAFMKTFRETNLALGKAFGKEEQAAVALQKIDSNLEELHARNKGKTGAMLFVVRGNVMPHAPGDRFGYAYELTGLESVLPAKDPNAPVAPRPEPGSPEAKAAAEQRAKVVSEVAAAEPDWLIVLDRGAINNGEHTAKETLSSHPELSKTKAFKEDRVYYVHPNGWYVIGGGLNNMKTITEDLLQKMQ